MSAAIVRTGLYISLVVITAKHHVGMADDVFGGGVD
jgi:hypothetical protein